MYNSWCPTLRRSLIQARHKTIVPLWTTVNNGTSWENKASLFPAPISSCNITEIMYSRFCTSRDQQIIVMHTAAIFYPCSHANPLYFSYLHYNNAIRKKVGKLELKKKSIWPIFLKPCIFKAKAQNPRISSVLGTNSKLCISEVRTPWGRVSRGLAVLYFTLFLILRHVHKVKKKKLPMKTWKKPQK